MSHFTASWQQLPADFPKEFRSHVQQCVPDVSGVYLAPLLWQRDIRTPDQIMRFLQPTQYQPTGPAAFGMEMEWAIARLVQARDRGENVVIWGDFDADGVTATAVLWEGLGQFFIPGKTLAYTIPNRLTESHGLFRHGIDRLQAERCHLIVTCDTGSTHAADIEYAQALGIDVIVTDHHTLPAVRPPAVAIVNPRYLAPDHPLATLSGVAVAYKLVEGLYQALPNVPQQPLEALLDLVAIGLIADLVELRGDSRYLAQQGIQRLQTQSDSATATRPGLNKLLELCKKAGDRPTDISFGIGPRINAVSRIHGDAHFCVELLTSRDPQRCADLALETELANSRRRELQKDLVRQVQAQIAQLDLSTTPAIILADEQWPIGILGLVAGQIAQEYDRPTILLGIEQGMARGSARSIHGLDLYELVNHQRHLLHSFGGHPYAAGLSLPVDHLPLFVQGMHQQLSQLAVMPTSTLTIDLVVTAVELGKAMFQELKWLEPYGMGNPVPRLLVQKAWFRNTSHQNLRDRSGKTIKFIKTGFYLCDETLPEGFPGVWWGHYKHELPSEPCDVVIELDFNSYTNESKGIIPRYEARLIALRPCDQVISAQMPSDWLLDWRAQPDRLPTPDILAISSCPGSWTDLQAWCRRAQHEKRRLALAYAAPTPPDPDHQWQQLLGIAKYLHRTGSTVTRSHLLAKLDIGDRALQLGFQALALLGFTVIATDAGFQILGQPTDTILLSPELTQLLTQFAIALQEEHFHHQYFYQVPIATLRYLLEPDLLVKTANSIERC